MTGISRQKRNKGYLSGWFFRNGEDPPVSGLFPEQLQLLEGGCAEVDNAISGQIVLPWCKPFSELIPACEVWTELALSHVLGFMGPVSVGWLRCR